VATHPPSSATTRKPTEEEVLYEAFIGREEGIFKACPNIVVPNFNRHSIDAPSTFRLFTVYCFVFAIRA
jgi:hypothetical protein